MEDKQIKKSISIKWFITALIIVAIIFAGAVYWYMKKQADTEKEQLNSKVTELENKILDLEKQAVVPEEEDQEAQTASASWKNYSNSKYGFSLTFNDLWKDFEAVEKATEDPTALAYIYFCIPTTQSNWNDAKEGMFCPFAMTVINTSSYEDFVKANDPLTPILIEKGSKYTFFYSPGQAISEDGANAYEDVKNIISTFKID